MNPAVEALHRWDVSPTEAVAIQQRLRARVGEGEPLALDQIKTVAGIDASYKDLARAAVVVFSFPALERLDQSVAARETTFPYVPGLLSFREIPAVLDAMAKLRVWPDLLMCDAQGFSHPRRFGLAAHLGVYLNLASIGVAKSRLVGKFTPPGPNPGDVSPLTDHGELIGEVLRTKRDTNPLFISVGFRITLPMAVEVVQMCLRGYRLPEPTRAAHNLATQAARAALDASGTATK